MKYRIREQNELKPSGVEWLGDIPKGWQQKKIKYLFNIGRGRVIAQDELEEDGIYPVYSSQTKNDGILGYIKTYDFDCKQLTWTTDGANAGTVFLREGKHNCTNVCGTLQQKNDNFKLKYLLFALQKVAPSYKRPDTNGAKIMNGEMAEIKVTFPSKIEQQKIASFLDEKSKIFDETISKKEQLILKLELAKQSLIREVVTGKLKVVEQNSKLQTIKREKNELKPSGVEWLGDIPKD
jgi:type I restriction enzyme S subunit